MSEDISLAKKHATGSQSQVGRSVIHNPSPSGQDTPASRLLDDAVSGKLDGKSLREQGAGLKRDGVSSVSRLSYGDKERRWREIVSGVKKPAGISNPETLRLQNVDNLQTLQTLQTLQGGQVGTGEQAGAGAGTPINVWEQRKNTFVKVMKTRGVAALLVFTSIVIILVSVNPPMTQAKRDLEKGVKGKQSPGRVMLVAVVGTVLAVSIPILIVWIKKRKGEKAALTVPTPQTITK
jgi:hypothetical protein